MSGLKSRFSLPGTRPSAAPSRSSSSERETKITHVDEDDDYIPGIMIHEEDLNNVEPMQMDHIRPALVPSFPTALAQRLKLWPIFSLSPNTVQFVNQFGKLIDETYYSFNISTTCIFYNKAKLIPRFAARYYRTIMAFIAGWQYLTVLPFRHHRDAGSIKVSPAEDMLQELIDTLALEFPMLIDTDDRVQFAAYVTHDILATRIFYNSLKLRHRRLFEACLTFIMDVLIMRSPPGTPYGQDGLFVLIPSIQRNGLRILTNLPQMDALLPTLPSDIPPSAFDGSKVDLFENDERLRLYLSAPKRIPLTMMNTPHSSHFPHVPDQFDDYIMPIITATATSTHDSSGSGEDFIKAARVKTSDFLHGSAKGLLGSQGRQLLPLCAVSVLERGLRAGGIHNEDRWWLANFVSDIGQFDIEDMGSMFDQLRNMTFDRKAHIMAHVQRYPQAIEEQVEAGYAPLMTPGCKAMHAMKFAKSERRASYCPFASQNQSTADEVRQPIKWQGLDLDATTLDGITEAAIQGHQTEGCLMHYNALIKATGLHSARTEFIKKPSSFVHMQALRRPAADY